MWSHRFRRLNWRAIIRLAGGLLVVDAIFMLVAVGGGWLDDGVFSLPTFAIAAIAAAAGASAALLSRPDNDRLTLHDAIFLTTFTWIMFSVVGALPFMFGEYPLGFIDAFFESASGYTSTGASVIADVERLPSATLLWRSIMQWLGGVGIIIFFLAIIPMLNSNEGVKLFNTEVSGLTSRKFRPRISQTAKGILLTYLLLTVVCAIMLWSGPMDLFDAVNQSMATLSTGGFSTRNASIGAWHSGYIEIVVAVFMFLGGVNLQLMYLSVTGHPRVLLRNDTLRYYLGIVVCVSAFVMLSRALAADTSSIGDNVRTSFFQVISAISSTGFACVNYEGWGTDVLYVFLIIMFFGACAGSTSSGAKTDRLIFLIKNTHNTFYRTIHPNHMPVVRVNGQIIPGKRVNEVIGFLAVYVLATIACAMIVAAFGLSLQDSMFASVSCISNIGLGYGATGASGSFASLAAVPKAVLAIEMLLGRLEIFTFAIIFLPSFWKR